MEVLINGLDELKQLSYKIGKSLKGNELIALKGPLGAGKTTFTKYLGEYLGVKENIISPTFNIIREYKMNTGMFYHIDAYRLEDLGYDPILDDYLYSNHIKVVEWYNFLNDPIFDNSIKIEIRIIDEKKRLFIIEGLDICID